MDLIVNHSLEFVPEPTEVYYNTTQGIQNSRYKSIVKHNFSDSTAKSLFGIRQALKSSQFFMVNHTAVILKLSVFALALIAIF